jgi:hypothetical protein
MKILIGRGFLRLALALWLIWFTLGVTFLHRELVTYFGVGPWTETAIKLALDKKCEESRNAGYFSVACLGISIDADAVITDEMGNKAMKLFLLLFVTLPFCILLCGTALFFLFQWVAKGFISK